MLAFVVTDISKATVGVIFRDDSPSFCMRDSRLGVRPCLLFVHRNLGLVVLFLIIQF